VGSINRLGQPVVVDQRGVAIRAQQQQPTELCPVADRVDEEIREIA
jgi:hypothetical protein